MSELNTHDFVMPNGRHVGIPITRVPVSYLKWMVCSRHSCAAYAEAELKRRGTVTPDLDISGHAIDRASLLCRRTWNETRREDEGLHAWLVRMAGGALDQGIRHHEQPGRIHYAGLSWRFELDGVWPVLKTVLPAAEKQKATIGESARVTEATR